MKGRPANTAPKTAHELGQRVKGLWQMDRLLASLDALPPVYLVGGAVRDLLLGSRAVDLDLCIEGDAVQAARKLAQLLGGRCIAHARFQTATVYAKGLEVDLATARTERYERPGALPQVEPASLAQDLRRRDFTINAMAVGLSGDRLGHLYDPHGGRGDLDAGVVRVLYDASFIDDPTRLLRAVRYECRLGFAMDERTQELARQAARERALGWVSGSRVRDALSDLVAEDEACECLVRVRDLGLDRAMHPDLVIDARLATESKAVAATVSADPFLSVLAAVASPAPKRVAGWIESLDLGAQARDRVLEGARFGPSLVTTLSLSQSGSELYHTLHGKPPEALALALALGAPTQPVLRYLRELRDLRLEISGQDMIREGIPQSAVIGQALAETFNRKLDGELSGRVAELDFALRHARGSK